MFSCPLRRITLFVAYSQVLSIAMLQNFLLSFVDRDGLESTETGVDGDGIAFLPRLRRVCQEKTKVAHGKHERDCADEGTSKDEEEEEERRRGEERRGEERRGEGRGGEGRGEGVWHCHENGGVVGARQPRGGRKWLVRTRAMALGTCASCAPIKLSGSPCVHALVETRVIDAQGGRKPVEAPEDDFTS